MIRKLPTMPVLITKTQKQLFDICGVCVPKTMDGAEVKLMLL